MQSLRVSLIAAYLDDRDAAEITSCEDPRLQLLSSLDRLELESCEIELESDDDYQVVATFTGGLAFIADQDGVRQIETTSQPQPKQE